MNPEPINIIFALVVGLVNGSLLAAMLFILAASRPEAQSSGRS